MRGALRRAAAALVVALLPVVAAAQLDVGLRDAARAEQPGLVASLREMVAIESGSIDGPGLTRLGDWIERRLQALGARTERPVPTRGTATLVKATFTGTGQRKFLLLAHMDTVYPAGTLAREPIRQEGSKLYGPGVADDKGGIAVILHSLAILQRQGWRDYATLTVLINGDEETGSIGSAEIISATADEHDYVISFEPSGTREGVLLGSSGTAVATLEVKGRAAHAGAAPQLGRNALIELAHQLQQTRDVAAGIPGAQLNWTTARAGLVRNQIPETASAGADVRLTQADAAPKLLAALQAKVASSRLVPDTETTVTLEVNRPPWLADQRARAVARTAQSIYAELDGRPLAIVEMTGGATDAGFAARSGKAVVVESFGLAGAGYHARDEHVELESVVPRLYLATRLLMTLARR
jgi:glutamate carboxypeptidase